MLNVLSENLTLTSITAIFPITKRLLDKMSLLQNISWYKNPPVQTPPLLNGFWEGTFVEVTFSEVSFPTMGHFVKLTFLWVNISWVRMLYNERFKREDVTQEVTRRMVKERKVNWGILYRLKITVTWGWCFIIRHPSLYLVGQVQHFTWHSDLRG